MYFVKSNNNRLLSIFGPIPILGIATNHVGFLSISPNNGNISKNTEKSVMTINSIIRNKETVQSNEDIKIGLKV